MSLMTRRWSAAGLAVLTGLLLAVSGSTAALARAVDPGGGGGGRGDDPQPNPCANISGSLTVTPSTITIGQPVTAQWSVDRPFGCEGTVSMITGSGAPDWL